MNLSKWTKIVAIVMSMVALTACSSKHKNQGQAINDANDAYGAQASGVGDQSGFGDHQEGGRLASNGRVYYFDFDSANVRSEDHPAIAANASKMMQTGAHVTLEGNTDPRGSREYNIALGERRAQAVAKIMKAKGVNPAQLNTVSYGAEKLASLGHSESDYQQDRRVVLVNKAKR